MNGFTLYYFKDLGFNFLKFYIFLTDLLPTFYVLYQIYFVNIISVKSNKRFHKFKLSTQPNQLIEKKAIKIKISDFLNAISLAMKSTKKQEKKTKWIYFLLSFVIKSKCRIFLWHFHPSWLRTSPNNWVYRLFPFFLFRKSISL